MSSPAINPDREIVLSEPITTHPTAPPAARLQTLPVLWREVLAVGLLVVVADLTLYRSNGFAGFALFLVLAPLLLTLGAIRPRPSWSWGMFYSMLLLLAFRMLCCGSGLQALVGLALLLGIAMVLA